MPYATQTRLGPEFTPRVIKYLILATCIASVGSVLLEPLFNTLFGVMGPMSYLSLSWRGIENYYLWQPFTYLFVYGTPGTRIGLFWLIGLALNMYILWIMGSYILERVGEKAFLKFYFISGILSGVIALAAIKLTGFMAFLGGPTASILALLTAWAFLNPESEILVFFVFPIKARNLVAIVLGVLLFLSLADLDLVSFFFYLSGAAIGYFYCSLGWGYRSPFPITEPFDRSMQNIVNKVSRLIRPKKKAQGKIFDIKTGRTIDDEERFMDAMLDKISKHGQDSLTRKEKKRMDAISKKKH